MSRRGLAVVGALAFALAACSGGDDDGDSGDAAGRRRSRGRRWPRTTSTTRSPVEATISTGTVAEGLDAFCDAELAAEVAAADDDDAARQEAFDTLVAEAPRDVENAVAIVVTEPRTDAERARFATAYGELIRFVKDNCGFNGITLTVADGTFAGLPSTMPAGPLVMTLDNSSDVTQTILVARIDDEVTESATDLVALPQAEAFEQFEVASSAVIAPGGTSYATTVLDPGRWFAVAVLPEGTAPGEAPTSAATEATTPSGTAPAATCGADRRSGWSRSSSSPELVSLCSAQLTGPSRGSVTRSRAMTASGRTSRTLVALAALSLTVAAGACGSDDDEEGSSTSAAGAATTEAAGAATTAAATDAATATTAATDETAAAGGGDVDAFCQAELEAEAAANGEDPAAIEPAFEAAIAAAPEEIRPTVETLIGAAEEGQDNPDFEAAYAEVISYMKDNCGFTEVDAEATEYSFTGIEAELPAGPTIFTLQNNGEEVHELLVLQVNEGVTETVEELLALPEEEAMTKTTFKTIAFAFPGVTGYGTGDLEPGRYLAICTLPQGATPEMLEEMSGPPEGSTPDGSAPEGSAPEGSAPEGSAPADGSAPAGEEPPPHFMLGMVQEFTVA